MRAVSLVLVAVLASCASAKAPLVPPQVALSTTPKAAPRAPARPPQGALFRDDVNALVERGFPDFLQRVNVEPRLIDGQFRGWSIVDLRPNDFWNGVDLKPGDVVTRVNDQPIERETEAFDVFQSLKTTDVLRVAFERNGQQRVLEYKIVSRSN